MATAVSSIARVMRAARVRRSGSTARGCRGSGSPQRRPVVQADATPERGPRRGPERHSRARRLAIYGISTPPNVDHTFGVSTTISPVTQMADAEVKKASSKQPDDRPAAIGNARRNVPSRIRPLKLRASSWAGDVRRSHSAVRQLLRPRWVWQTLRGAGFRPPGRSHAMSRAHSCVGLAPHTTMRMFAAMPPLFAWVSTVLPGCGSRSRGASSSLCGLPTHRLALQVYYDHKSAGTRHRDDLATWSPDRWLPPYRCAKLGRNGDFLPVGPAGLVSRRAGSLRSAQRRFPAWLIAVTDMASFQR